MGVFSGPETVSNGLVFSYDIANTNKSWIGRPTTNSINAISTNILRYNNPGFTGTSVNTGQTYKGMPIYELTFIPQDSSYIPRLASGEGFGAYHPMAIPLLANTSYMASIYMKSDHPLQSSVSQGFQNGYSNISGWTNNGTVSTRYQEDGWTRLYTQYFLNQNGYSPRTSGFAKTFTVNTSSTQTIDVSFTVLATGDSLLDFAYLHALVTAAPAIASNGGLTGLSIVDHGLDTTTFTKLSWPSSIKTKASNLPFDYFVRLSVPSTGGVNTNITLNANFTGYYTALTDNKFWKVTFDTTNATVNQVFRTYWCGPMLEQHSTLYPSTFINGTRTNTQALLDMTRRNTITADSLNYDATGTFNFNGTTDYFSVPIATGTTRTVCMVYKLNNPASGWGPLWRSEDWKERVFPGTITLINSNGTYYELVGPNSTTNIIHIAYSYNGTNAKSYLNGVLQSNVTMDGPMNSATHTYNFGRQAGGSTVAFVDMSLYTVQFYDTQLTDQQIQQNFNAVRGRFGI